MRPRYNTHALVLARTALGEASVLLYLLTSEFGLVKARAQGLRKPGAKLSHALQTLREVEGILVRGKDGWRLSGASLIQNHAGTLSLPARACAGRIAHLILRLMHGDSYDTAPFFILQGLLRALPALSDEERDAAECLAALRILSALGLDTGTYTDEEAAYEKTHLEPILKDRRAYIVRINRGIEASGL